MKAGYNFGTEKGVLLLYFDLLLLDNDLLCRSHGAYMAWNDDLEDKYH